jgi:hypothetical protein
MNTTITPVASGQEIEFGPRFVVAPAAGGATLQLYRRFAETPLSCRSGDPVVAIVRTDLLNTPDRVTISASERVGRTFTLTLDIRRFDGPLAANDPWIALIRIELGSLPAAEYELIVHEIGRRFTQRDNPDQAEDPTTRTERFVFACDGGR